MATAGGMWALLTSCYIYTTDVDIQRLLLDIPQIPIVFLR